jgi:hypothetical protein
MVDILFLLLASYLVDTVNSQEPLLSPPIFAVETRLLAKPLI